MLISTYKKCKKLLVQKPILVVPLAVFATLLVLVCIEYVRASIYLNRVKVYKNSPAVVELTDKITLLNRSVELSAPAALCDISHKNLLPQFNEAYQEFFADNVQADQLLDDIYEKSQAARTTPRFWSIVTFIPKVQDARTASSNLGDAINAIETMSDRDARSHYCVKVNDAITRTYFLQDLQTPQGVSALFVGQLENFQVNVSQAQEILVQLPYPSDFETEHTDLIAVYQQIAQDLRENENNYSAFARRIENDVAQLEVVLARIKQKSTELQEIPKQLIIEMKYLQ